MQILHEHRCGFSEKKPSKKSDEEDEQEEKPVKKSCSGKCPYGHNFGDDCDMYPDDCDKCDCWDKCCSGK